MMNSLRLVVRRNVSQFRQFHKCVIFQNTEVAAAPIEALTIPYPTDVEKPISPKIDKIANDITALNLIEVAELSDLLKKRLNLPDAPVMPLGGFAPVSKVDEDTPEKKEKTSFMVKLTGYDDKQKVPLIKEIKIVLPNMNLVQAKKFVEQIPAVIKSDVSKEEAEALKMAIEKVGGQVELS